MCGIVACVGAKDSLTFLTEALRRLAARRYDSAGLAVVQRGKLHCHKRAGSVEALLNTLPSRFKGRCGIGHTRWASHGEVSDSNAHPHTDSLARVALVHNGIIENVHALRHWLAEHGVQCQSDTDTEVLAQLVGFFYQQDLLEAVSTALERVVGTFGVVVIASDQPKALVAARRGSPLFLGVSEQAMYLASEVEALVRPTQTVVALQDDEVAWVTPEGYQLFDLKSVGAAPELSCAEANADGAAPTDPGHHMLREILEQPQVLRRTLRGRLDTRFHTARLDGLNLEPEALRAVRRIKLLGCGSAYHAALYGAQSIERLARVPCSAESAAEFFYRHPVIEPDTLFIAVSQSGETHDTWQAVQEIQRKGGRVIGVVNAVGSRIARACQGGMYLHAGQEQAVSSTKSFTAMLLSFVLFGLYLGRLRDLSPSDGRELVSALQRLPDTVSTCLAQAPELQAMAESLSQAEHAYFVGRGPMYPLAMEGALKLKEVSYIHAEAYPVSALKHGPIAMVSKALPSFMLLPCDEWQALNRQSVAQIRACGGPLVGFVQLEADQALFDWSVRLPCLHPLLDGIALAVAMQLFAYHAGVARGCEIDQPRHLSKSVSS